LLVQLQLQKLMDIKMLDIKNGLLGCLKPVCQTTEVYEPVVLKKNDLKVYPNPTKFFFNVEYDLSDRIQKHIRQQKNSKERNSKFD